MIRGLWISASGLDPAMRAQEILANNLANVGTEGFRADHVAFHRLVGTAGGERASASPPELAEAASASPALQQRIDLTPASIETTDNPFHLALQGAGFFTVQAPEGERYSRDGSLRRAADGTLLHASGHPIASEGGSITVPADASFVVASDGRVLVNGESRGRLKIVSLPDATALRHAGQNLLSSATPGVEDGATQVVQGALESANVDPVDTMVQMMALLRTFEANQRAILTQDGSLARLINWAAGS